MRISLLVFLVLLLGLAGCPGANDDDATANDDDATANDDDATANDDDSGDDDDATTDDDDSGDDDDDDSGDDDDDDSGDDDDATGAPYDCAGAEYVGSFAPTTDAEVTAFCDDGYGVIVGDAYLAGSQLSSTDAMGCLCAITGLLEWGGAGNGTTSSVGMQGLTYVGGDLAIAAGAAVSELDGFDSLHTVGGLLYLSALSGLGDTEDLFPALTTVGSMDIGPGTFSGLGVLDGFDALETVAGDLLIHPGSLTGLGGFGALTSIGGDLALTQGSPIDFITAFDGPGPLVVQGDVSIETTTGDASSTSEASGFGAIVSIGGDLRWYLNTRIAVVSGFEGLQTITGTLFVDSASGLTTLSGFDALTSVGADLWLNNNSALADISGLLSLTSVGGDFTIQGNGVITNADAEAVRDAIGVANIGGTVLIQGNN